MPHVAQPVQGQWNAQGIFGKGDFAYDAQKDELICPAGKRLHKRTEHARNRQSEYAAHLTDCRDCALKAQCTRTRSRVAHRHWDQDYLNQAQAARQTQEWRISQRFRKFIEHLFAEAKELMGLRRARRRGIEQVREQCLMTATVQNIKRIVKALEKGSPGRLGAASDRCVGIIRIFIALLRCLKPLMLIWRPVPLLLRMCSIKCLSWKFQFASV